MRTLNGLLGSAAALVFVTAGCIGVSQTRALAQESPAAHTSSGPHAQPSLAPAARVPHWALQGTVVNRNLSVLGSQPSSFVNVDAPTQFNCPASTGKCSYELQADIQVLNDAANTGNRFAVCFLIDGVGSDGLDNCFFSGVLSVNGQYEQKVAIIHALAVRRGRHTVQTQIYTDNGVDELGYYDLTYRVYTAQ